MQNLTSAYMKLIESLSSHKCAHSDKNPNVMCLAQDITLQHHTAGQKINQQEIKNIDTSFQCLTQTSKHSNENIELLCL